MRLFVTVDQEGTGMVPSSKGRLPAQAQSSPAAIS